MKGCAILLALVTMTAGGALIFAQGGPPGGGPGGPGGMRQRTPKMILSSTFRSLGKLSKNPLNKDQATKILAVVGPWKTKDKMTDDDARQIQRKLKPVLNEAQLNELDQISQSARRPTGGGPGGGGFGGGFGGAGKGGAGKGGFTFDAEAKARFQKIRDKMKDSNPFNIPKFEAMVKDIQKENPDSPFSGFMGRGIQATKDTFVMLEKTAKGGGTAAAPKKTTATAKKK